MSWAYAFDKKEVIETTEKANKGFFHGFDATDIPKSKFNVCLNSFNLIQVERVENCFMEEIKEEDDSLEE